MAALSLQNLGKYFQEDSPPVVWTCCKYFHRFCSDNALYTFYIHCSCLLCLVIFKLISFLLLFRILFPEIQPRLASLLKKGYKVLLYLTFMLNLICSINIFLVVFAFVAQVSSSYLFLFRWCFSPIRWVFLEANSDRRCSSQKLRIFYRHCSCPSR